MEMILSNSSCHNILDAKIPFTDSFVLPNNQDFCGLLIFFLLQNHYVILMEISIKLVIEILSPLARCGHLKLKAHCEPWLYHTLDKEFNRTFLSRLLFIWMLQSVSVFFNVARHPECNVVNKEPRIVPWNAMFTTLHS